MVKNLDFLRCKEERENKSFFKVLQGADISSENMREIPQDFVRSLSHNELSRKMKIITQWGKSWEVKISKNPRFYFMEKAGWEKFVTDNFLGDGELLTFTHKGKMRFTLNIFNKDGKEMLQPRQAAPFLASSSRIKIEQDEEEVVSSELSCLDLATEAESNGRGKGNLNFGKNKAKDSEGASSSSSVAELTITVHKSYLIFMLIPVSVTKDYMPEKNSTFKIHHPDMKKSWDVAYVKWHVGAYFSDGWRHLVREYPLVVGDTCKFTFTKPTELLLVVSKPKEETH